MMGKPVLEWLLTSLAEQGVKEATIFTNGDGLLLRESIQADNRLKLEFLNGPLPVGTAGCIREVTRPEAGISNLLIVFPAGMLNPPKIDELIKAHREGQADLTVNVKSYSWK